MKLTQAQELEAKKVIARRILAYRPDSPPDAANELMKETLSSLEQIFTVLVAKHTAETVHQEKNQQSQEAQAEIQAMRQQNKLDAAWAHTLVTARLSDGRRLCDSEANRNLLEDLIGSDDPSSAAYRNLCLQFANRFSWETPPKVQSNQERRAEFEKICKDNFLSLNAANEQLHREGVGVEYWSGCSEVERQAFQQEAALRRQKFLINTATDQQLKEEARYEFQQRREASIREDAQRRMDYVAQQQRGLYPPLPEVNGNGEEMNSAFFRRILIHDYKLFKDLCKRHGSAAVTARMHQ
jgi:hypothetical protein